MTPDQLSKSGSEHGHQVAFFAYVNVAMNHGFGVADLWANGHRLDSAKALAKLHHDYNPIPELKWVHAIPNGGSRGDTEQSRKVQGGKLKAEGVKAGIPDLFVPIRRGKAGGLYIEMKKPGGKPSAEQKEFGAFAIAQGYQFEVCDSYNKAVAVLKNYMQN
jgi:hypothetical protein